MGKLNKRWFTREELRHVDGVVVWTGLKSDHAERVRRGWRCDSWPEIQRRRWLTTMIVPNTICLETSIAEMEAYGRSKGLNIDDADERAEAVIGYYTDHVADKTQRMQSWLQPTT